MSENDNANAKENIEVFEEVVADVTEDGTVVSEDVTAAVDLDTGEAVIDDVVAVVNPDGSGAVEETVTMIDADGNEDVVFDEVTELTPE